MLLDCDSETASTACLLCLFWWWFERVGVVLDDEVEAWAENEDLVRDTAGAWADMVSSVGGDDGDADGVRYESMSFYMYGRRRLRTQYSNLVFALCCCLACTNGGEDDTGNGGERKRKTMVMKVFLLYALPSVCVCIYPICTYSQWNLRLVLLLKQRQAVILNYCKFPLPAKRSIETNTALSLEGIGNVRRGEGEGRDNLELACLRFTA